MLAVREPLPDSLMTRLQELRLCSAADVHRAGRFVRRLTRDLPAFDSVWIDGLTQLGVLTPFQARWLETEPPEKLVVGDYVLLEGFGAGTASRTFLAADRRGRRFVLKRLEPPADELAAVELRLEQLRERTHALHHPLLTVPLTVIRTDVSLFVAGRHVAGRNVSELLIRRGRFPARVVLAMADQMLAALSTWHAAGLAHGDLRLTKIRLTDRGQVVLVDGGLQAAVCPELLIHRVQSAEEADVIAPERIGSNTPATAASDLYAVGCVLWQLLTGRPPYPSADPLSKLAAHQTRRIVDVRELAPDTPRPLAELIHQLTASQPLDRPSSAAAARHRLGLHGRSRAVELVRFLRQFDITVPHLKSRNEKPSGSWKSVAAALLLLGGAVAALSDRGLRTELLQIADRVRTGKPQDAGDSAHSKTEFAAADNRYAELPAPDPHGVVTLTEAGPYAARNLTSIGSLTITAAEGVRPRILIEREPLSLAAPDVTLKNVEIVSAGAGPGSELTELVQIHSQRFHVSGCRFIGPQTESSESIDLSAISWKPIDRRDPQAGLLVIESTRMSGPFAGLRCDETPRQVTWRQVLKTGGGSAVRVDAAATPRHSLKLTADHATLRETGPLLTLSGALAEQTSALLVEIETQESVFQPRENSPLVECRGPTIRPDWHEAIRFAGEGSLLARHAAILAAFDAEAAEATALDSGELQYFEGLLTADFEFAGPVSADPHDSRVTKANAPRRSSALPGADPEQLPSQN